MRKYPGFTLIEMMVVVAIIGIMASIAIPTYQNYMARSQLSEAMTISGGVRSEIASSFMAGTGSFIGIDSETNGIAAAASMQGSYVESVSVADGIILVTIGNGASEFLAGEVLTLTPMTSAGGNIVWGCSFSGDPRYLPQTCR
jgi:type IV pilus assembly protein PilA